MTLNVLQDFLNTKPWNFTKSVPPLKSKQKVPQRATCPCCSMDTTCPHSAVVLNEAGLYLATGAEKVCGVLGRHVPVNTTETRSCSQYVHNMWTGMHSTKQRDRSFYFTERHWRTGLPHRQANHLTPVLSFCWSSEEYKVIPTNDDPVCGDASLDLLLNNSP